MAEHNTNLVVGVDLHGTLLDGQWRVPPELVGPLQTAMARLSVYVCTGNDLGFIHRRLPCELRRALAGYVLETGCVLADGTDERVIVPEPALAPIRELRQHLEQAAFQEVLYLDRRLATISLFTRDDRGRGQAPETLFARIQEFVANSAFAAAVQVTHSDVAVDIVPAGHNKYTGMQQVAAGRTIAGIADSFNDFELIAAADYGFIPSNASPHLLRALAERGKIVVPLARATLKRGQVIQCAATNTAFVLEALSRLR